MRILIRNVVLVLVCFVSLAVVGLESNSYNVFLYSFLVSLSFIPISLFLPKDSRLKMIGAVILLNGTYALLVIVFGVKTYFHSFVSILMLCFNIGLITSYFININSLIKLTIRLGLLMILVFGIYIYFTPIRIDTTLAPVITTLGYLILTYQMNMLLGT